MSEIRYPYKPKFLIFILVTLFFSGCAAILAKVASSNTQGVVINRLIELSAKNATIFYWCLVAAAFAFVLIGALGIYSSLTSKNEIVLTDTGFSAPKRPVGNKIVTVNYADIKLIVPMTVQTQRMLKIEHEDGNIIIQQSSLPNKQAYDEVVETITAKTHTFRDKI